MTNTTLKERLQSKVLSSVAGCDCLNWVGAKTLDGYGKFRIGDKTVLAHRLSFFLKNGSLHEVVMHTCDNPSCVNPDHLVSGSQKDNMQDCLHKGRLVTPRLGGEDNPNSKLSSDLVMKIRNEVGMTQRSIGMKYGVSQQQVSKIKLCKQREVA